MDPTLFALILLLSFAVAYVVVASTRRAGIVNPKARFSGAQLAVFVVVGAACAVLVAGSLPSRGQDPCRAHKQQQCRHP